MTENEGVWWVLDPGVCSAHVFADTRVLDLIPWLAGAFAFLVAGVLLCEIVVWLRALRGKPNLPRFRRDAQVPPVVTGRADNGGDVR